MTVAPDNPRAAYDDAYDRLCEAVADPRRVRVTVRARDLQIVLTELVHRR